MPKFFLEQIYTLIQQAPLPKNLARVRTSTHGCQIISRLHAFGSVNGIWTVAESENVRNLILQGQATIEVLHQCFRDRSDFASRSKRNAIGQELSTRPWSTQEDQVILQFVSEGRSKALSTVFRRRDESSIGQLLRELTARPVHNAPPLSDTRKGF
jgi:hypothetical protein